MIIEQRLFKATIERTNREKVLEVQPYLWTANYDEFNEKWNAST